MILWAGERFQPMRLGHGKSQADNGTILTDPYATATLVKLGSVLHHVAEVKMKTITRQPMRPTHAGKGCKPARNVEACDVVAHRLYSG